MEQGSLDPVTAADVAAVLKAAGVPIDPEMPFYWQRRDHQAALADEATKRGLMSMQDVLAHADERKRKISDPGRIRTMRALFEALG